MMPAAHSQAAAPHWSAQWLGVPYSVTPEESRFGANCWGFFRMVMREQFGRSVPLVELPAPESAQDMAAHRAMLREWQAQEHYQGWREVPIAQAQEGDALLLAHRQHVPDHIGVVVQVGGALRVLHCARGVGAMREPLARVVARWRFAEVWRVAA